MILSSVLMGQRKVVSTLHHLSPGPYWELQVHRCIDNTAAHTYRLRYTSAHTQALPHKGTKIHTKGSQNIKHHTHTRTHTDIVSHIWKQTCMQMLVHTTCTHRYTHIVTWDIPTCHPSAPGGPGCHPALGSTGSLENVSDTRSLG